MKLRFISTCLLFFISPLLVSSAERLANGFYIRFGAVEIDASGKMKGIKETSVLPLKFGEDGLYWGCEIYPPNSTPYTLRMVYRLPSAPALVGGISKPTDDPKVHYTEEVVHDWVISRSSFVRGDPLGEWSLEIIIDGKSLKTYHFTVVAPSKLPASETTSEPHK